MAIETYKSVRTPIDNLTQADELVGGYVQQLGYRTVRAKSPARDGNRFKYQSNSNTYEPERGDFLRLNDYISRAKAFEFMVAHRIDLNHDGATPPMWTASMITSSQSPYPGVYLQASDADPTFAVFKMYLKNKSVDQCVDVPL